MKTTVNIPARTVVKLYELARKSYTRIVDEYGEEAAKDEAEAIKAIEDNFSVIIDKYKYYENKICTIAQNPISYPSQFENIQSMMVLAQTAFEADLDEIDNKFKDE